MEFYRVAVSSVPIAADDQDRTASKLGKQYDASMVIWGADTGVQVTVNFLNLKHPDFDAAHVQISETQRTQIANPDAYASFVNRDLPGQLSFLSLFAVGQSYYNRNAFVDSIKLIETGIADLAPNRSQIEGLAEAYFRLGWLYQMVNDSQQSDPPDTTRPSRLTPKQPTPSTTGALLTKSWVNSPTLFRIMIRL